MSSLELNKIAGAIILATLIAFAIGKIGDNLVAPGGGHGEAPVVAVKAPPEPTARPSVPKAPEVPFATLLANADLARGKRVFNKCKACHTVTDGGKNGIGPNLWNVVNAEPTSKSAFKYSAALQGLKGKPWTYENLNAFLTKPKNYAKGTKMTFVGIKKPADRANVIFYLRSLSATPAPLE